MMRAITLYFLIFFAAASGRAQNDDGDLGVAFKALDPLYANGKRVYLQEMAELGMRLGVLEKQTLKGDVERGQAALTAFRDEYVRMAEYVPPWKPNFSMDALSELKAAIASHKSNEIKAEIIGRIERSCTACHARFIAPVAARFRWDDFSSVWVDGGKGTPRLPLHQIMLDLATALGSVRADALATRLDEARADYDQLQQRFGSLVETCQHCHSQPREYFVDARVKVILGKIGGTLKKGGKEVASCGSLADELRNVSCLPCHLVHMPAAFFQRQWKFSSH